jgi:transposase InsO family protein
MQTVLTDNPALSDCRRQAAEGGIQFTFQPRHANGPTAQYIAHMFDMRCREHSIEHRLTKIRHPWTNGQIGRMNRTIKDATVKRYHYENHEQLTAHLHDFIDAHNYGRRLKTLRGLTPYEYICKCWTSEPDRFTSNPQHQMPGPNT